MIKKSKKKKYKLLLNRDIPREPNTTIDHAWGIKKVQPVCPNCDYYLTEIYFLGNGERKVSYCEICGQAIDWRKWKYHE